jgi:hypothetical protein
MRDLSEPTGDTGKSENREKNSDTLKAVGGGITFQRVQYQIEWC